MVEVVKIMATSVKRSHACTATLSAPNPAAGPHRQMPSLESPGHSQARLVSLLWGHCSFRLVLLCTGFCLCPPRFCFPVLCKFWRLYGGVIGYLLPEGLCHTQVCRTQSPCPCSRPLLTIPPQETLTHSSVSVSVGSLGPGVHKVCLSPLSFSGRYGV